MRIRSAVALASWIFFLAFVSQSHVFTNPGGRSPMRRFSRHLLAQSVEAEAADPLMKISNISSSSRESIINPSTTSNSSNAPIEGCQIPRGSNREACSFIRAHPECDSGGMIRYTRLFFCKFGAVPWLGHALLGIWLASLFYMLGNTAADYFCCSLQKLSSLLHLPPTVAGVSLLPLGNGAPDVFASIAAFIGAGAGEVGLNSVLGGAVFVTSVVAGLVYVVTSSGTSVQLDRNCFIRDVCFFLFTLACLVLILYVGKISFWGAVAFISIYLVYAFSVAASEVIRKQAAKLNWHPMQDLVEDGEEDNWYSPLRDPDCSSSSAENANPIEITLPQWRWASNVAIYAHQQVVEQDLIVPRPLWGWSEQQQEQLQLRSMKFFLCKSCKVVIDWPLTLPRQLTIPLVEENRWSRPVAIASVTLAPILLGFLLSGDVDSSGRSLLIHFLWGAGFGAAFGVLGFLTTVSEHPPRTFVFPWVAGGFLMSIVWFYIIAKELVAVLVSLGVILEIDSSILGLTVLAWGNSMGDLMANVAMAYNGGDGVQVAVSGCYAGPMFNTLVGLGISLVLASLNSYPAAFVIPSDSGIYYTIGFLVIGLLWTLAILPNRRMKPNRLLGIGLLLLYSSFLGFRILRAWGQREG